MKKKILLISSILFLSLSNAQTTFGVKAGYNLSNMKWTTSQSGDYKFNSKSYFYAGGLVENKLSDKFSVQGELLYTEIGGKTTQENYQLVGTQIVDTGYQNINYKFSQIQVPISAKYFIVPSFSISTGLNFGFNISPKVKVDPEGFTAQSGKVANIKTLNLFPFLGTEYQINKNIFADARYNFNFFKISNNQIDTKIGFLQIGLGYKFN